MSVASRNLQIGDKAFTDFNGDGFVEVTITRRFENTASQSGICYAVSPALLNNDDNTQFDADWFEIINNN